MIFKFMTTSILMASLEGRPGPPSGSASPLKPMEGQELHLDQYAMHAGPSPIDLTPPSLAEE